MTRFPQAGWSKSYQPPKDRLKFLDALFWPALALILLEAVLAFWLMFRALKGWPI